MHVSPRHTQLPATPIIIDKRIHGRGQLEAVIHYIPARLASGVSEATHAIITRDNYDALVKENHRNAESTAQDLWQRYGTRTLVSDEYLDVFAGARAPVPMDEFTYTLRACPSGSDARDRHPHRAPQPAYQPRTKPQLAQPSSLSAPPSLAAAPPSERQIESTVRYDRPSPHMSTSRSAPPAVDMPLDSSADLLSPRCSRRSSPEDESSSPSDAPPPPRLPKRMRSDDLTQLAADATQWSVHTDEDQCLYPASDDRTALRTAKRSRPFQGGSSTASETIRHIASRIDSAFDLSLTQLAVVSSRGHWINDPAVVLRCCRAQLSAHELLFVVDPSWRQASRHNGLIQSRLAKSMLASQTDSDARRQAFVTIFGNELFRRAWLEYADWSNAYLTPRSGAVRNAMISWLDDLLALHAQGLNWRDIMGIHYDIHSQYVDSGCHFVAMDFVLYHKAALAKSPTTSNVDAASASSLLCSPHQRSTTLQTHRTTAHNRQTGAAQAMKADGDGGDSSEALDDGLSMADKGQ